MDITVPAALKALSTGSSASQSILSWFRQSRGDIRALVGELKNNLSYLDLVARDGVKLDAVIDDISVVEYTRLSREGFDFNKLKKASIPAYPSLAGTALSAWAGKETEQLVVSIYDKINDLKIRYPHVKRSARYRWRVRVNNIRVRIWL